MNDPLAPWQPDARDPFDLAKVGHLVARVGYAASLPERRELQALGPAAALARLMPPPDAAAAATAAQVAAFDDAARVRQQRVWDVLHGVHPSTSRLTSFWHDHFATADRKVQDVRAMAAQMATFDRLGAGRFDELLAAMCRDPALLRWLDNDVNTAARPNENFARELFELFTLGRGAYDEADVRTAARAFTGWHVQHGRFVRVARLHDDGDKSLFGVQGALDGDDVLAATVVRRESAEFLAAKWLRWYVHPEPDAAEIRALADVYRRTGRDVGATLRTLFTSRLFFAPHVRRSKVKSPAEFVLGTVRLLGGIAKPPQLLATMAALGETWLEPPSVEGWHRERAWLSPAAWLLRTNFVADLLADARHGLQPPPRTWLPRSRRPVDCAKAAGLVLLSEAPTGERLEALTAIAAAHGDDLDAVAVAVLHAVACTPEYQLL